MPERVAVFFTADGSLTINGGDVRSLRGHEAQAADFSAGCQGEDVVERGVLERHLINIGRVWRDDFAVHEGKAHGIPEWAHLGCNLFDQRIGECRIGLGSQLRTVEVRRLDSMEPFLRASRDRGVRGRGRCGDCSRGGRRRRRSGRRRRRWRRLGGCVGRKHCRAEREYECDRKESKRTIAHKIHRQYPRRRRSRTIAPAIIPVCGAMPLRTLRARRGHSANSRPARAVRSNRLPVGFRRDLRKTPHSTRARSRSRDPRCSSRPRSSRRS